MAVRYPSLAHRKQTTKHREQQLAADVAKVAAEGFVQEPVTVDREPPVWPPVPSPRGVDVFDLDAWTHPGRTVAPIGPFVVLCGMCPTPQGQYDLWADAKRVRDAHYQTHYNAGETA